MMPGENHSKTAGIAAEAAGSCQNCTSLQQSLNEYVAALIALKQKIIDSDHLIAEYQQKCDDLQDAERENKTLRCELEQMLQKTFPREQTKHQLKTLRIDTEQTSTIEDAQPSKLDNARVKDECKKCNMAKKKHEAKLKKVQAVASKHIKNVKKLQQEKRILERELKHLQKKLGDIQNKKTMKNSQTQVANDHPVLKLDKKKIRILLEELWNCIETSAENSDGDTLMLETYSKKEKNIKNPDDCRLSINHLNTSTLSYESKTSESAVVYAANNSTDCQSSNEIHTCNDDLQEHTEVNPSNTETSSTDTLMVQDINKSHLSEHESSMEELLQIMNWAKPLPPLLSPLGASPLTTKYVFGEFTDSSDNEGCEGKGEFVGSQAQNSTIMENKLTCLQDQANVFSCPETTNITENRSQNVSFERNEKSDSILLVTDCMETQSEINSNCQGDLITITEMETDKKDVETAVIQNEVRFEIANSMTTNILNEQHHVEKENNMLPMVTMENSVEESSVCYPDFNVPVKTLSSINDSKEELQNPSSTATVGNTTSLLIDPVQAGGFSERLVIETMQSAICNLPSHNDPSENTSKLLISKDPALHNCNLDDNFSKEQESAKSLQSYKITSAGENYVHDDATNAKEKTVHDIISSAGENQVHNSTKKIPVHDRVSGAEEHSVYCSLTSAEERLVQSSKTGAGENNVNDNMTSAAEKLDHIIHSRKTHALDTTTSAGETPVHDRIIDAGEYPVQDNITGAEERHVQDNITGAEEHHVQDNITGAEERHVQDNITGAEEHNFHSNLSVNKQLDTCGISDIDMDQDHSSLSTKPEVCLNEYNHKFNYDFKQSYNCNLNVEMHIASETIQHNLNDHEETVMHSDSSPVVQLEHTKIIDQYDTENIDKLDPKYIQESSIKKESISLEQTLSVITHPEDCQCCKEKPDELGYGMQDPFTFVLVSTDQTLQGDEASSTSLQLDSSKVDKENKLSESFGGEDSSCLSVKKLEDKINENIQSDLETQTTQMEKTNKSKCDIDEAGTMSKFHVVNEQCKINSSETDQLCSSENVYTSVSSKEQKAVVTDIQPFIENQQGIHFQNESVDDQSVSTVLLQSNKTFPSHSDTANTDGFLEEEHVVRVTESIDQLEQDLCKVATPQKEFHEELDSEKTNFDHALQSNKESHPMKFNQPKIMLDLPLEKKQQPNVPSESSKVLNNISDDSSEEDDFLIRKVSYTKVASRNLVNLKESCKSTSEMSAGEKVCSVHLELTDAPSNPVVDNLTSVACANDVLASGGSENTENDILMEHSSLVTVDSDVNSENGKKDVKNSVDQHEKNETINMVECETRGSENQNTKEGCSIEKEARKILPSKNLIWNFERPDDCVDSRVFSGKHKLKANVKMLHAGSENLIRRTEKRKGSQKVMPTELDGEKVGKQRHQQKLSVGEKGLQNIQVGETVLANADTSTKSDHSPETITKVRSEMGPPLPPLLGPLLATPPKYIHPLSPILSSCSSLSSPLDDLISPLPGTPFPQMVSPLSDRRRQKSPVFATPSPAEKTNSRILSSPLQFCAATPKHALPVPGRLPLSASSNSSTCAQENSVKILDTMYPELSARARTLNILKGNVQLNRGLPIDGKNVSVNQISGFKPITSTSTAFIKTGGNSKADGNKDKLSSCKIQQQPSRIASPCKRTSDAFLMPRSAKKLRLDSESPVKESMKTCSIAHTKNDTEVQNHETLHNISYCKLLPDVVKDSSVDEDTIPKALKKIEDLCIDLQPVITSHIFVGTIPKVPVMRNEEKEVIYEFSHTKKGLADCFLQVILKKIKTEKSSMAAAHLQALCRVYVGLCRQLGDIERARVLCYNILKEGFPEPDRLLLFIVSSWNDIISTHGVVSKAIQAVLKNLVKEDVGSCLSAYLNWEKTPPMNVNLLLSSVLMAIQLCPDGKFQQSEKYGEDLTDHIWEYVFAVDLLCNHQKWLWTHDTIISKELWPLLDKWVKRKKGNPNVSFIPDIIAATVLRLVGFLCQMGLKEGFVTDVKNIGRIIIAFLQHANEEGMCWGVQLACVYMLFDLAPSDPGAIYKTLQAWKASAKKDIPPAVASCMQELQSTCGLSK